jgi:hypothetical protein
VNPTGTARRTRARPTHEKLKERARVFQPESRFLDTYRLIAVRWWAVAGLAGSLGYRGAVILKGEFDFVHDAAGQSPL